jgi:hypothetical protein
MKYKRERAQFIRGQAIGEKPLERLPRKTKRKI